MASILIIDADDDAAEFTAFICRQMHHQVRIINRLEDMLAAIEGPRIDAKLQQDQIKSEQPLNDELNHAPVPPQMIFIDPISLLLPSPSIPVSSDEASSPLMQLKTLNQPLPAMLIQTPSFDDRLQRQAKDLGCLAYLIKPVDPDYVESQLKRLMPGC